MSNRQLSNGPYFITTAPSITTCSQCNRPVLAATADGLDRHVDLATLNDQGELSALVAGRATYDLRGELLSRRHAEAIVAGRPVPVLADHVCAPVDDRHVDHIWDDVAVALVHALLGAAPAALPANPPF